MPPSSKRSQRTRKVRDSSPSPAPTDQTASPSRPPKRRKKVQEPTSEPIEEEGSSLLADTSANLNDDDRLVAQVTQRLAQAGQVQARIDHSNAIHEARAESIEAYAKIAAHDWTYFITSLSINIGRTSEPGAATTVAPDDPEFVHIDLGPGKHVSRQTAVIYFDSDAERWFLQVKGRNGVKVDNNPLRREDEPHALSSGEVIEVGGLEMMFVMPTNIVPIRVHPTYLERLNEKKGLTQQSPLLSSSATAHNDHRTALPSTVPTQHFPSSSSSTHAPARPSSSREQASSFPQPIAPAPPDYKRVGTPPSSKRAAPSSAFRTPAHNGSASMIMNQNDVDLSKDENKHIKPHFSYAQMITQAIMATAEHKLNLAGVYQYITSNYAYYRAQPAGGWQNSIRHNLSLNKSFSKAPRSTDEPGKGMKWEIVPEAKEEMFRVAYKGGRGGHRGSSAPSSPSQAGQAASALRDTIARETISARKRKGSPTRSTPPTSSYNAAQMTPDRKLLPSGPGSFQDGSPLPRARKPLGASSSFPSDNLARSPPTLSSSYQPEDGASFVTPAPLRVHPRLAPPSTAQRPSQHMPTSSPAPFWRYADINSTPLKFNISPSKPSRLLPECSSPPPVPGDRQSPVASPTRSMRAQTHETTSAAAPDLDEPEVEEEEEGGFDLTKGFQPIASYHAPIALGGLVPRAGSTRAGK
ncbi:forkhead box protein K2 [Microdochium trichocladiopsis]|uniref:Forkhead box protein K2 n=1 Tax=Microdochium trichocladiopsis TaxID=1682393 RepID=A0A9P8YHG8_9PEZI|nr:forkhead box protein K2 [Microdochium trichocladiopsis]KAH7038034.1 forkhead box protein K2 [Microdochium trichocladiopsis]